MRSRQLFVWWYDIWLTACAGHQFWKTDIRHYSRIIDKVALADGQQIANVTPQSEGFGLLLMENCQFKWKAMLPHKAKDSKWKVPAYKKDDKSTHVYHNTAFSDSKSGQVKGGGWKPEAFQTFNDHV